MDLGGRVPYVCLIKACTSAGTLQQGRQLHSGIVKRGQLEGVGIQRGIQLNNTTFTCLVVACSQEGQVSKVFSILRLLGSVIAECHTPSWPQRSQHLSSHHTPFIISSFLGTVATVNGLNTTAEVNVG